jgi:hypothetical protein
MRILRAALFFVSTLLLYLGLPLFGWGLDDLGGFFSIAPRAGYALAVVLFGAAVGVQAFHGTEGLFPRRRIVMGCPVFPWQE